LNDLIDRLQQSAEKALRAAYDRALLWLFLFIAFVVLGAIGSSAALDRLLSRRLARLREGTAIIGSGRLDYRFPIEGSDELWDLAIASNEMAAKLQDSHTSINHLQQEISERERAQEALRVLFARQEALLAAVPDIIMEVDCNKMYTWANQAGIEFFGEDVIGREAADYFFGEQDTYGMMQPLFNGDENTLYVESLQRRKDGQERLLAWWCRVLKDDRGNVTGSLSSARDITEIKLAERQKADMEAQLRHAQKLESIGTLASGVAHEINNPINGVMNYAQLILDQSAPGAVAAEYAREIISETERVAVIVRNLLQFARQEKQTHSPARMEDIIDAVLSLMGAVLRHDQIRLEVDIGAGLPTVKCRSQQIQQVVMNMLSNARDALNEKYPDHHEDKAVSIRCRAFEKAGRPWMRVTVEDHGGGISLAIRDRIFDPFFTTKSKDKGTGLGLAISHGLVKEHHGDLHFETEPGHWTRFHLDLPVNNGWALQQAGEGKGNG
jgi:PAS domain S-box-containing protein